MDIKGIRRLRLEELTANRGDKAKLARATGFSPSQISQWLSDDKTTSRQISEDTARVIEVSLELPVGWMDSANMTTTPDTNNRKHGHVYVQSYELWQGQVEKEIRFMSVSMNWLEKEGYSEGQIISIEMPDDSQAGLVNRGYEVAVNIEWGNELINDVYYAIKIGGSVTIRRVEYTYVDDIMLRCQNPDYSDQIVSKKEIEKLDVVGIAVRFQGSFPKTK